MNCPFCKLKAHRMDLHAHLLDAHSEEVKLYEDATGRLVYDLTCPICNHQIKKQLKKHPSMLKEYEREIKMVAFDVLLHHIMVDHSEIEDSLDNRDR